MRHLMIASLAVLATALPASADAVLEKAKSASKDGPLYIGHLEQCGFSVALTA
jgi:hypothetical protein